MIDSSLTNARSNLLKTKRNLFYKESLRTAQ
jgi:hypothetical protein